MEYSPAAYTNFCVISEYFKTNKSKKNCNYSSLYNSIFNDYREESMRIIEFDVSTETDTIVAGGSLQAWSVFLPNSEIIGIYQDQSMMYQNDKIESFLCEKVDKESIQTFWSDPVLEEEFDVIIESGLVNLDDKITFMQNSLHKVKSQGFYFMENLDVEDSDKMCVYISDWRTRFPDCEYFYEIVENGERKSPILMIQKTR